jgi:hypothetical protein
MILREQISLRDRASIELKSLMIRPSVCVCVNLKYKENEIKDWSRERKLRF